MADSLAHRGPDDHGEYVSSSPLVALGHRRLSIIDLSSSGRQPFVNEDSTIRAIVNGEIYNYIELRQELKAKGHRFVSDSDCEVLVHLYEEEGISFWSRLRGMFAAAVLDERIGVLYLGRDPLGIKPLYIYEDNDRIAFSSEIRAFRHAGFSLDHDIAGISDFLMMGSIPAPRTHFRQVTALMPGQIATIHQDKLIFSTVFPVQDWCLAAAEDKSELSVEHMSEVLSDSIKRHMISDAPIGLFLSGGIDSGMLAGMATELTGANVHTVSVTVPGNPLDEGSYAAETASLYGTIHREVPITQDSFEQSFDLFFDYLDMPSIDGFNSFVVARAAREAGLTVSLSGVGGDELFAGYPTFSWGPMFEHVHQLLGIGGSFGRTMGSIALEKALRDSSARRVGQVFRAGRACRRLSYLSYRGLFLGDMLADVLEADGQKHAHNAQERFMDDTKWVEQDGMSSNLAVAGLELSRFMGCQLLRDMDVASMAHSLEVRVPLVDQEVVKAALPFLAQSPLRGDGHPKWLLRQGLQQPLPARVVSRKKQGFVFPWQEWMRGKVVANLSELVESKTLPCMLSEVAVRKWLELYLRGKARWSYIWALFVLSRLLGSDKK